MRVDDRAASLMHSRSTALDLPKTPRNNPLYNALILDRTLTRFKPCQKGTLLGKAASSEQRRNRLTNKTEQRNPTARDRALEIHASCLFVY
jgi:hypothetical protein